MHGSLHSADGLNSPTPISLSRFLLNLLADSWMASSKESTFRQIKQF